MKQQNSLQIINKGCCVNIFFYLFKLDVFLAILEV